MILPVCRVERVKDKFTWAKVKAVETLVSWSLLIGSFSSLWKWLLLVLDPRFLRGERLWWSPVLQKHDHTQVTLESVSVVRVTFRY